MVSVNVILNDSIRQPAVPAGIGIWIILYLWGGMGAIRGCDYIV